MNHRLFGLAMMGKGLFAGAALAVGAPDRADIALARRVSVARRCCRIHPGSLANLRLA